MFLECSRRYMRLIGTKFQSSLLICLSIFSFVYIFCTWFLYNFQLWLLSFHLQEKPEISCDHQPCAQVVLCLKCGSSTSLILWALGLWEWAYCIGGQTEVTQANLIYLNGRILKWRLVPGTQLLFLISFVFFGYLHILSIHLTESIASTPWQLYALLFSLFPSLQQKIGNAAAVVQQQFYKKYPDKDK